MTVDYPKERVPLFCCELAKICIVTGRPIEHTNECVSKHIKEVTDRAKARIPQTELPLGEEDK